VVENDGAEAERGAGGRGAGGRGAGGRGAGGGGYRNRLECEAAFLPLTLRSHALVITLHYAKVPTKFSKLEY